MRNRRKFGPHDGGGGGRYICRMHVGVFDLEHVMVIWGHSVHLKKRGGVT